MIQDRSEKYSFNSGKLSKLNREFGIRGKHMAGKDFKVLQIREARVCHQLMSRKVKERYSRLEGFDRHDKSPLCPTGLTVGKDQRFVART